LLSTRHDPITTPAYTLSLHDALPISQLPLPMFDNSAMDGYAVIARDCKKGTRLRVIGEQPAGVARKLRVSNGEAVRIFTGAPIPDRKSTRLNSSHLGISYAVFCLKKK